MRRGWTSGGIGARGLGGLDHGCAGGQNFEGSEQTGESRRKAPFERTTQAQSATHARGCAGGCVTSKRRTNAMGEQAKGAADTSLRVRTRVDAVKVNKQASA
eukprot:6204641-Pleurochrysis_carterae.AAC.1